MENCAFIDIVTTGNDLYGKNNCPIQFCCEIFPLSEVFSKEKFYNPSRVKKFNIVPDEEILTTGYIRSSGLTNDSLEKSVDSKTCFSLKDGLSVIYRLLSLLKDKGMFIVGYNHVAYDLEILNKNFKRVLDLDPVEFPDDKILDVMKFAEVCIPLDKIGNYTMESVFTYVSEDPSAMNSKYQKYGRSASTDIRITKSILTSFMDLNESFSDLVKKINEPHEVKIMNFGKYKGAPLEVVFENDKQYCNWLIRNKDISKANPGLVDSIRKMMNTVVE
jgi:hypothetical protein